MNELIAKYFDAKTAKIARTLKPDAFGGLDESELKELCESDDDRLAIRCHWTLVERNLRQRSQDFELNCQRFIDSIANRLGVDVPPYWRDAKQLSWDESTGIVVLNMNCMYGKFPAMDSLGFEQSEWLTCLERDNPEYLYLKTGKANFGIKLAEGLKGCWSNVIDVNEDTQINYFAPKVPVSHLIVSVNPLKPVETWRNTVWASGINDEIIVAGRIARTVEIQIVGENIIVMGWDCITGIFVESFCLRTGDAVLRFSASY